MSAETGTGVAGQAGSRAGGPAERLADRVAGLAVATPTVPFDDPGTGCTLWFKLEYLQPSGSTKDRFTAHVLGEALATGELGPHSVVVEASSGSTSISFAMACARLGLRFRAVMPAAVSSERVLIIRRYGGEVALTDPDDGMAGAIEATREMAAADPAVFLPRQFENPANVEAHARTTGPELIEQVAGPVHGFVAGVGTAGTLMGVGRALRRQGQPVALARAVPTTGVCFAGQPEVCCGGGVPGIVEGMSTLLDPAAVGLGPDIEVGDDDVVAAARELCGRGFPVGLSSGLNLAAARRLAAELGPGHNVATVCCDRMERYFSTPLFGDVAG